MFLHILFVVWECYNAGWMPLSSAQEWFQLSYFQRKPFMQTWRRSSGARASSRTSEMCALRHKWEYHICSSCVVRASAFSSLKPLKSQQKKGKVASWTHKFSAQEQKGIQYQELWSNSCAPVISPRGKSILTLSGALPYNSHYRQFLICHTKDLISSKASLSSSEGSEEIKQFSATDIWKPSEKPYLSPLWHF